MESIFEEIARSYLGVRFCHQGRSRSQGLDCVGYILSVKMEEGWTPISPLTTEAMNYSQYPDGVLLKKYLEAEADEIKPSEARSGDMLLMKYGREPQHVGFFVSRPDGNLSIIHSLNPAGVVEHIYDGTWSQRTVGCYRFKEAP